MSRAPAAFFARLIRRRLVAEPWPCSLPLNGDFNLFVDDGTGYIVYNSDENGALCGACHIPPCDCGFQMSVEKLAPDFKSSALENSGFIGAPTVEAPAMFKRASSLVHTVDACCVSEGGVVAWAGRGVYYLLFDRLSCFGPQGSGAVVYTSTSPMGAARQPPPSRPPITAGECCL